MNRNRAFGIFTVGAFSVFAMDLAVAAESGAVVILADRLGVDAATTTRVPSDPTASVATQSFTTLTERVANLHINSGGAGSFGDILSFRGLANTPYFSDPSVTVYLDDLPLASSFTYPTGLFGFFDAAVSRGPQSTVFGRGGQGGTLSLLSKEPGPSAGSEWRAGFGRFGARTAALQAHTAGGGAFDATLSGSYSERDGLIRNTALRTDVDHREHYEVSTRARWRPTDGAELTLQALANHQHDGAQPLVPLGGPYFEVDRGREGRTEIESTGLVLKGAFNTPLGPFASITSYTDWSLDPYDNRLVLPPPLDSRIRQSQQAWNEELRLTSHRDTAVEWIVGAWFSMSETTGTVNREIPDLFPIEASHFDLDARTAAFFGEAAFTLNKDWRITAGLRAETTNKDFARVETVPGVGLFTGSREFNALLPKLAVRYRLSADTALTATLSRGSRPGGWSAYTGNAALAAFDAEKVTAFDLSFDIVPARERLSLSTRVFAYDIRDYQIERSFNASDYLVVNAPKARSLGAEIETEWHATPALTFTAALGATRVTLREFADPFTGVSYAGNSAPYAPSYDANLSATYRRSHWFARGEINSTGRTFFDESESSAFEQRAHTTLAVRAGYDMEHWRITLFGDNLTDERYYTLIIPGVMHAAPGTPRSWGVELGLKF